MTYSQRNWVEVFYREAKRWLGLSEYQVRDKRSLLRHFVLVFCAYTFILWHTLTGGFRRRWANKPLNTFTDSVAGARTRATALEAFRTAMSCRFIEWLNHNRDVFTAYKASLDFIQPAARHLKSRPRLEELSTPIVPPIRSLENLAHFMFQQ